MAQVHAEGEVIRDRYRIVGVIGRGGMGTTYRAADATTGRDVALKHVWLWHGQDWKVLDLFEREARILADLAHPAIPRYVDHFHVDTDAGPAFYLAQEIAPGQSLDTAVRLGFRPNEREAQDIVTQLLRIAEYLQARTPPVIHRDIKPANVMRDESGGIYLVDFGSVRDTYRSTAQGSTIVGTFGFMAPEQFYGHALPATDVYGIAATAVTLLTGLSPEQIPRKRDRPDFRARAKLSRGFGDWLDRALAPDPNKRFENARTARLELERTGSANARGALRALGIGLVSAVLVVPIAGYAGRVWRRASLQSRTPISHVDSSTPEKGRLKLARDLVGHYSGVFSIKFLPSSRQLLTSASDGTVKLWDIETGNPLRSYAASDHRVTSVSVTADGKTLVLATGAELRVYDVETAKLLHAIGRKGDGYFQVAIAPDGSKIAAGTNSAGVQLFSLDGALLGTFAHPGVVVGVDFSSDGSKVASAGNDGIVRVWDVKTRQATSLRGHSGPVSSVAFSADVNALASAGDDHTLRTWILGPNPGPARIFEGFKDEVWCAAFSGNGKMVAAGAKDGSVGIWDTFTGERIDGITPSGFPVTAIAFSPDGHYFVTGTNVVHVWALREPPWQPPAVTEPVARTTPEIDPRLPKELQLCIKAEDILAKTEANPFALRAARLLVEQALTLNPKLSRAHCVLSRIEAMSGYKRGHEYTPEALKRARDEANLALKFDPDSSEAHVRSGYLYLDEKDFEHAHGELEAARKLDPRAPRVFSFACEIAKREEHYDEAFLQARALYDTTSDPNWRLDVYEELVEIYGGLQEWDAADATHRSLLNLKPDSAWARVNYAGYLIDRQDYEGAEKMAKAALAISDFGMGHHELGRAYALQAVRLIDKGDLGDAERLLDRAAKEFRGLYEEQAGRGLLAKSRGDKRAARRAFEAALKIEPNSPGVKQELAALDDQ